jgi:hypothetical protein
MRATTSAPSARKTASVSRTRPSGMCGSPLAALEQDRHAPERLLTRWWRGDRVADQAAAEADHRPETQLPAPGELEREAGALREAQQGDPLGRHPGVP